MAEFVDLSEVMNRLSGGNSGNPETFFIDKTISRISSGTLHNMVAGKTYSAWLVDGGSPGCGLAPGAAAVPTSATQGAIPFTNASGGREKRLIAAGFSWGAYISIGTEHRSEIFIYDRLFHISNLSGTSVAAQNVQSGSGVVLTRNTGGIGNEIWIEIYGTAIGATTGVTATCSYTNQAGTAGRTTQATPVGGSSGGGGVRDILEMGRMQLQAGDTGVQSVETLTLSGSTGTAGVLGVTIVRPLAYVPIRDAIGLADFTFGLSGTPVIESDACLALAWREMSTTNPPLFGFLATAER